MRLNFKHLPIVFASIFVFLSMGMSSCTTYKLSPEHRGVDPKAAPYVKEFKELAQMQGIAFEHEVTVGFKKLNGSTIGLTTYGPAGIWHEIDLDPIWWEQATELSKLTLIAHESIHAYCDRGHTFGNNEIYPEYESWNGHEPQIGHYRDGTSCPLSIMYPVVLDDFCMLTHYTDYMIEMYRHCVPY